MVPYIHIPTYQLGPVPLDPWGLLVTAGFVLGLEVARARGIAKGLDVRDIVDAAVFIVLSGFVGGHLVHILAYHPEKIASDGWITLARIWEGFSSFGGFFGAVLGAVLFFKGVRPRPFLPHADAVMFAFPFAWIFGRAGCALVHDHIGRPTDFFLAVNFDTMRQGLGVRHDLGLYECLYSMVISAVFFALRHRPFPSGTFLVLWCAMYAPVRFLLDFLRRTDEIPGFPSADVRWAALTPAQWGCLVMAAGGIAVWTQIRTAPPEVLRGNADDAPAT